MICDQSRSSKFGVRENQAELVGTPLADGIGNSGGFLKTTGDRNKDSRHHFVAFGFFQLFEPVDRQHHGR
jgi:hypothetical protein